MAESEERVSGLFAVSSRSRRSLAPDGKPVPERPMDVRAVAIAACLIGLAIGATVATVLSGLPM